MRVFIRIWRRWPPDASDRSIQSLSEDEFMPFGAGQRKCIGAHFADLEGVFVLGLLLRRLRFHSPAGELPPAQASVTLRPRDGLWLETSPR